MIGTRLAHYEITALLGKGGMGEVYRATDTKLGREVALKILPAIFASDPERMARFEREARTLAAVQHPNIASIYGFEEAEGHRFLVMELAEGEELSDRIARGAIPVDEALQIGLQIAEGLETAHENGIVHRDLKPANVIIGADGQAKLLDFGLARAIEGDSGTALPENSPTLTAAFTAPGVILGTAAYMSPEQARGHTVDSRSDVWAFGVILWELLAGKRLFAGETVSDTLAMVLRAEPDWDALPEDMPPSLNRLLRRCLQRDKRQRMHHIADARIVMEEILQDGTSAHEPALSGSFAKASGQSGAGRLGWAVAAVLAVVAAFLGWRSLDTEIATRPHPVRFDLNLPADTWIDSNRQFLSVSPTGDAIAMALATKEGTKLYLRSLDDPELVPIPGTESGRTPFFSPDGEWVAFTQNGMLRKTTRDGKTKVDLCPSYWGGGTWLADGRIIITESYLSGLLTVPAGGGAKETLTEPDRDQGELGHWWPQVLPGDEWLIYTSFSSPIENARIMALSLVDGTRKVLVQGGVFGRYSPSGHLMFTKGGQWFAASFDLDGMEVLGVPESVLDDVYLNPYDGYTNLTFGSNGTLAYVEASVMEPARQLVWVDRDGTMTPLDVPARNYRGPEISPDGKRIAVAIYQERNLDVWLHDLGRGTWSRFTFGATADFNPRWTPDGSTILYNHEEPQFSICQRPADGSTDTSVLLRLPVDANLSSISPDGDLLVFSNSDTANKQDIMVYPLDGSSDPRAVVSSPFNVTEGAVSPDGNWLAYQSNESGSSQIYAVAFPQGGSRIQISIDGGQSPLWSPRGDEIFFMDQDGLMVADVDLAGSSATELDVGRPRRWTTGPFGDVNFDEEFCLTPDGERFLITYLPEESLPRRIRVVANWFTELAEVSAEK